MKPSIVCLVILSSVALVTGCKDSTEKISTERNKKTETNMESNQTKNEYDMGYKVENDEVIVYGREYKESDTYNFDTNIRKLEDHDIDVIKNGIIPPIIEVDDHVKKMTIKKDCRLVWRVDYSTYNPAFDNNLRGCKNLEEINVESGNDSISSLEGILYKNVKKKKCLYACPLKKSGVIIIPEDIDNIWACAFFGCEQITSVEISSSVRGIGNHAFGNMKNCKSIHVNKNNPYYTSENGVLYTKNKKVLVAFPAGKSMDTFVIPEGVEYISEGAFSCVDCIKKIIMPKSLKEICNCAFFSCKNLVSVKARGNVKKIGYYAFYKTPTPKHMNIPRKKGKNSEYSVEWRKLFDGDSLKNDTAWVDGYGFE